MLALNVGDGRKAWGAELTNMIIIIRDTGLHTEEALFSLDWKQGETAGAKCFIIQKINKKYSFQQLQNLVIYIFILHI